MPAIQTPPAGRKQIMTGCSMRNSVTPFIHKQNAAPVMPIMLPDRTARMTHFDAVWRDFAACFSSCLKCSFIVAPLWQIA